MARQHMSKAFLIQDWWRQRIGEGTQIDLDKYPFDFLHDTDYRGEGPWYRTLTTEALYRDFVNWRPGMDKYYTKLGFVMIFRQMVPHAEYIYAYFKDTADGSNARKKAVRFRNSPAYYSPEKQATLGPADKRIKMVSDDEYSGGPGEEPEPARGESQSSLRVVSSVHPKDNVYPYRATAEQGS